MEKDSKYHKRKIDLLIVKNNKLKEKRKKIKFYKFNRYIMYKKLEKKYLKKTDEYFDDFLYALAEESIEEVPIEIHMMLMDTLDKLSKNELPKKVVRN